MTKSTKFRSAYSDRVKVGVSGFDVKFKAQQQFKDQSDINRIMKRYETTGHLPSVANALGVPRYMDVTNEPLDFHDFMNLTIATRQRLDMAYLALPEAVRAAYETPAALLAALEDPHERSRLEAVGVLEGVKPPEPQKAEGAAPPVSGSSTVPS